MEEDIKENFREGHKHGSGISYSKEGRFEGEFKKGERHGHGICYYSNGDIFEGEYQYGAKNGKGVLYENGEKIEGVWIQGNLRKSDNNLN